MIEGKEYIKKVSDYFGFLKVEFGFRLLQEKIRGNVFYDLQFKDDSRIVSISYENIEDYFLVTVFILQNGEMPDYDDKSKTLHLNILNRLITSKVSKQEIMLNAQHFDGYNVKTEFERRLLKEAKELRLCLKHFPFLSELS